jgi:HTH-type transcriptional regulator / antitoxin MqsA
MEKPRPHCKLTVVKAFVEAGKVRTTQSARREATVLGLGLTDMLAVVMALTPADDSDGRCSDRVLQGAMTMKCPVCGAAELIHDTRDLPYTYKGETTTIPAVTADFCPACDESITGLPETDRIMREMQAFNKQVNAAIVDPGFIVNVRKKLDLGQREAAEIFGGGINAFSRYENGKTKPPLALVKLFKLLDRHPDLLDEVKAG